MRLVVTDRDPAKVAGDVVVALFRPGRRGSGLPLQKHLSKRADKLVAREEDALTWLETRGMSAPRVLLASLGAHRPKPGRGGFCGDLTAEEIDLRLRHDLRGLGALIERACNAAEVKRVILAGAPDDVDLALVLEGMGLRAYQSREWRDVGASSHVRSVTVCVAKGELEAAKARLGQTWTIVEATNFARELGDLPSNVGTPMGVVERLRPRAEAAGLQLTVIDQAQAREYEMGLFCAVAEGSNHPGCVVELEHNADRADELPTLVLVGKGITHDTGGYNLKTTPDLYALTNDKCGATAVMGAMVAIAELDLPLHVIAILPLAENSLDNEPFKPGDILEAHDGTSVFIENTDAEGRLVLADALSWADQYRPDAVIDLATLTRAAAVSMGDPFAALFSNDDRLRDLLVEAGRVTDDLVWPLPIHRQHEREIGHYKADLKNMGGGAGSASSAAAFLRHFVDYPWAHVDLAGKASWEHPRDYLGEGATGFGCRLLVQVARELADDARAKRSR